jgi:endonuclease/exonuclease/phosphatase family metal-dependent hydrolase
MRLLSYNIFEGGVGRVDPLCQVIREADADVVFVAETWNTEFFETMAKKLNMEMFQAQSPTNPRGHVGLLSKWPIHEAINFGPLDQRLKRAAIRALLKTNLGLLGIVGVHLYPYETPENEAIRLKELEAVLEMGRDLNTTPHLLMGDFNSHHPDQKIDLQKADPKIRDRVLAQGGQIPRLVVKKVLEAGYLDAHAIGRSPEQWQNTFTTAYPELRVDYIFAPMNLAASLIRCEVFKPPLARYVSDHYPLLAEFRG